MRRISRWEGFYVGALQIDPHGNSNLLGLRAEGGGFRMRGPGAIGTPSVTAVAKSFRLVVNRHDTRTFVESCDYVSCPGWLDGSEGARERLGLAGGPQQVLTPLCVLGFAPDRRLRVDTLHPGVTLEQVQQATGFAVEAADDVAETPPPTEDELEVLRTRVDPHGVLREERNGRA
jgi:glutaconate CoA-transferase subunit B